MTQKITGAQALIRALELENVDTIFGLPGGCILPAYDPLLDSPIRHILVRHEQGAGHMAEGYAHVTGRPGVAMVTSGPAATNMVTPLCDAYMDSIPMVCITGQVSTSAIGTDAFQECDTVGITRSVTKHNELIMSADDVPLMVRQAFHIATTGRPGPVLLDLPKDVLQNSMTWHWPSDEEVLDSLPGYKPVTKGHPRMIKEAARMILDARSTDRRCFARVGRTRRHARRHHVDGARCVPRRSSAVSRYAGHARQRHGDHRDAKERSADHARCAIRRPHHRQGRHVRA
jgi:acetolactate synthase-1/2/3 large subunit